VVADEQPETLPYEHALRAIGRHLDAEPAYNVSILEVDDGFTVRYQPTQYRFEGRTVHFGHDRLRDLLVFQSAGRGTGPRHDRHRQMWTKFPDGHEEFLRALGFLLDHEGAQCLTLDELAEEVRVTYVCADSTNPVRAEKRDVVLREPDIRMLVETARTRRRPRPQPHQT
jgi:hypothetical protein